MNKYIVIFSVINMTDGDIKIEAEEREMTNEFPDQPAAFIFGAQLANEFGDGWKVELHVVEAIQ